MALQPHSYGLLCDDFTGTLNTPRAWYETLPPWVAYPDEFAPSLIAGAKWLTVWEWSDLLGFPPEEIAWMCRVLGVRAKDYDPKEAA